MPAAAGSGTLRVIGLTGPAAGGKTAAAEELGRLGAKVIELDTVGHELLAEPAVREEIDRAFPQAASARSIAELRKRLAAVVFSDPAELARLERILHARMCERVRQRINEWRGSGEKGLAVIVGALVFEMGLDDLCEAVVLVDAPRELRLERAKRTRGWSEAEIARREARQLPLETKRLRSSRVFDNSGTEEELKAAVSAIWEEFGCQ